MDNNQASIEAETYANKAVLLRHVRFNWKKRMNFSFNAAINGGEKKK